MPTFVVGGKICPKRPSSKKASTAGALPKYQTDANQEKNCHQNTCNDECRSKVPPDFQSGYPCQKDGDRI
jgi:hypothetical protein